MRGLARSPVLSGSEPNRLSLVFRQVVLALAYSEVAGQPWLYGHDLSGQPRAHRGVKFEIVTLVFEAPIASQHFKNERDAPLHAFPLKVQGNLSSRPNNHVRTSVFLQFVVISRFPASRCWN